jgi:enolase
MSTIKNIFAYEIIDSRGYPTIEARMILDNGIEVSTSIPAGTSTGKYEAHELRDKDPLRYDGMGVTKAVDIINKVLLPKLIGIDPCEQESIDDWLIHADATAIKERLGANTTLAISQLCCKAGAKINNMQNFTYINMLYNKKFPTSAVAIAKIPTPTFNLINGGKHAYNTLDFQEFLVIPSSHLTFSAGYQLAVELFHELKRVLTYRNAAVSFGEEGGYSPNFSTNLDALEIIKETCERRSLLVGNDIFFGMDIAAGTFYEEKKYKIKDKPQGLNPKDYELYIHNIIKNYSIMFLEDPFQDDDWPLWSNVTKEFGEKMYIVGDDLITANKDRLKHAIDTKACNTMLIKPNQIGTLSECFQVINTAKANNFAVVVSHRSGETNDDFIADFAVGIQADFAKFGAPNRGERVAKYNRLNIIEKEALSIT